MLGFLVWDLERALEDNASDLVGFDQLMLNTLRYRIRHFTTEWRPVVKSGLLCFQKTVELQELGIWFFGN